MYPDGRICDPAQCVDLPNRTFDKRQQVNQAAIVENKRLGPVLAYIAEKQKELDMSRSTKAPRRRGQRNNMFKSDRPMQGRSGRRLRYLGLPLAARSGTVRRRRVRTIGASVCTRARTALSVLASPDQRPKPRGRRLCEKCTRDIVAVFGRLRQPASGVGLDRIGTCR